MRHTIHYLFVMSVPILAVLLTLDAVGVI